MKTLATLLLAIGLSFSSFALDKRLMEVSSIEIQEQRFAIKLSEAIGKVRVTIFNPKGHIINRTFFEITSPQNIPFNLSDIPEGLYKVKLDTKDDSQTFDVKSYRKVETKLMAYAKAVDKNTFNLKVLGVSDPGTMVTIFSNNHKVLMKDEIQETGGFSKNYHLKHLILGQVYLKVEDAKGKSKYLYFN
ncbi:DUF3244 domain-containing protein [uncultured Cyclobacterium sp.]|uniref:DUF3244 domain-containing protein n=1 Tax=uncultured Cyclobacterium sp. TaxID=453820 RepID=UPI0030EF1506